MAGRNRRHHRRLVIGVVVQAALFNSVGHPRLHGDRRRQAHGERIEAARRGPAQGRHAHQEQPSP